MFLLLRPEFYSFLVAKKCSYFYVRNCTVFYRKEMFLLLRPEFYSEMALKNRSKIDPEGVPGRSLGMSVLLLEAPGAWSRHFLRKEWKVIKIWTAFYWSRGRPGDPVGTQKSTKNAPGPENGRSETVHGTIFYRLLPRSPFFSLVSSILARFCSNKKMKKNLHGCRGPRAFSKPVTLTKHCAW